MLISLLCRLAAELQSRQDSAVEGGAVQVSHGRCKRKEGGALIKKTAATQGTVALVQVLCGAATRTE